MNKISIVDFLRGWSIFTIVLMHLLGGVAVGVFSKAIAFGGAGVHVFILCSGFGLFLSYLRKPLEYSDFLKRRFSRIWIPYAIAVLFWGLWILLTTNKFPIREVASHLLLYKMFSNELDISLCLPYWFISTIIQYYLAWPLIVRLFRLRGGGIIMLIISMVWSTTVGLLGYEEERPWGSFFLQYLWEFCLGMWIAKNICNRDKKDIISYIQKLKWWWLMVGAVCCMGLSAFLAWNGGWLKLYNDIPSLFGYLSVALLIYKIDIKNVNRFFEWANSFSYELYLVHSLVFTIIAYLAFEKIPMIFILSVNFITAYLFAYMYSMLTKKISLTWVE